MVDVKPFLGIRYNSQLIEDISPVMAPPYDVISKEMQEDLYYRSEYNVVRLILGKEEPSDDEYNNKYVRAANFFQTWRSDGILVEDEKESLYIYRQIFKMPDGSKRKRIGLISLVKLEDFEEGTVMAHENTFAGPKADRLKLIRTVKCNLSSIFTFYNDKDTLINEVYAKETKKKPWQEIVDDDDVIHQLWVVSRKDSIDKVVKALKDKHLYIADGHHRYETALKYRNEMREGTQKRDSQQPFDYVMMYVTSSSDENLVVLPTHRVLNAEAFSAVSIDEIIEDLSEYFDIKKISLSLKNLLVAEKEILQNLSTLKKEKHQISMLLSDGSFYILSLKPETNLNKLIDSDDIASEIKQLDVTILHKYIIMQCWIGNPDIELEEDDIYYIKDVSAAIKILKKKKDCVAFFLNPITMEEFKTIVSAGLRMPHKSTYFYPKLLSGLVMRDLTSKKE